MRGIFTLANDHCYVQREIKDRLIETVDTCKKVLELFAFPWTDDGCITLESMMLK